MARLRPISEQFRIARQGALDQVQKTIVQVAKTENARIMATDPKPSSFRRTVDGKAGAPEEAVKPDGVIIYTYQRLDEVVAFALETLQKLSPVLTGAYAKAHTIFVNGSPVAQAEGLKAGDDVAISNPEPYARKIEVGKMKMRVPGTDHVYQQAEQIVNSRYGNLVKTRFTYRGLVGGSYVPYQPSGTPNAAWSKKGGIERANRQPALVFIPKN